MRVEDDGLSADLIDRCDMTCATVKQRGERCRHQRTTFDRDRARRPMPAWRGKVIQWLKAARCWGF